VVPRDCFQAKGNPPPPSWMQACMQLARRVFFIRKKSTSPPAPPVSLRPKFTPGEELGEGKGTSYPDSRMRPNAFNTAFNAPPHPPGPSPFHSAVVNVRASFTDEILVTRANRKES